jgi:chromosome segregation ATPase
MSKRTFHLEQGQVHQQPPPTSSKIALQYQTQVAEQSKARQQDEMELLSLQRELRDKNREYRVMQSKYEQLNTHFKYIRDNHRTLLSHLEELKQQIEEVR